MARRSFGGGTRMSKGWDGISGSLQGFAADGTAILGTLPFTSPGTILRIIGEYAIGLNGAPTAGDVATVSVGIAVVSSDAAIAGATALPEAFGDQPYPWLYWASHAMHFRTTTEDPSSQQSSGRFSIDVKSMRKVKDRETVVWIADYFNFNGDPPLAVAASALRILIAR